MSDEFSPYRVLISLEADLQGMADLAAATGLAGRIADFCRVLAGRGASGEMMTRLMSGLNDRLSIRIIELTARRYRLPSVDWCWLALGSEGRHEQTLLTDQDNALVFQASDGREAAALRNLFQPFAAAVNDELARAGFTLCPGLIMAGNPDCCLSLDEWRERFIAWVRRPEPAALLNASIFFDLRPLCGALDLGENLRRLLLGLTVDTPAFLYMMAANALQAEAPLNFRGEVVTDAAGEIDLKKFGSRIFVDAARIFALAAGVPAVNSSSRLGLAHQAAGIQVGELAAISAAYSHILRLRLEQQIDSAARGEPVGYGLKPARLHDVDRTILRESLKQAKRLQQRLKLNYAL